LRLLLDTHLLVWFAAEPSRLRQDVVDALQSESTEVLVSVASWWELGIKHALGRLEGVLPPDQLRAWWLGHDTVQELTITAAHALAATALPQHHRDPFDRVLLAQAHLEGATYVSSDRLLRAYGFPFMEAQR
jgi:PIN domain nuclease of toxin-antitoxin system